MAQLEFSKIPIIALNLDTIHTLSLLLTPKKVIQSEGGLPRDWRGLASLCEIPGEYIPALHDQPDPTSYVLNRWMKEKQIEKANFERLQFFLEKIDRFDVHDDITHLLERDAAEYIDKKHSIENGISTVQGKRVPPECQVLTIDDVYLSRNGSGCLQTYNGLLLYSDEDYDFACYVIKEMEKCELKLCVKDRDLLGGLGSEHSAVLQLLVERCARLVVILSPEFLASPENSFFLDYAQALGIDQGRRKIVPILYKPCNIQQLRYYHMLDYPRSLKFKLYNFWEKLRLSIHGTPLHLSEDQTNGEEQKEIPEAHIDNWKGNGLDLAHGHPRNITIREFDTKMPPTSKVLPLPAPAISVTACPESDDVAKVLSQMPDFMSNSLQNMSALDIEEANNMGMRSASLSSSPIGSYKETIKKSRFKKLKKIFRETLSPSTESLNEIKIAKDNNKKKKWFSKASPSLAE